MFTGKNFGMRTIQFAIIALLLAIPLAAVAQVTTATIVGTVTDPGGSIVPGATVCAPAFRLSTRQIQACCGKNA